MTQYESDKAIIFKPGEVEGLLRLTHGELTYLRRRGLVKPAKRGSGRGSDNGYRHEQLFILCIIRELRSLGIETSIIKEILKNGDQTAKAVLMAYVAEPERPRHVWVDIHRLNNQFSVKIYFNEANDFSSNVSIPQVFGSRILIDIGRDLNAILTVSYFIWREKKTKLRIEKMINDFDPDTRDRVKAIVGLATGEKKGSGVEEKTGENLE
jgi:DNA-binding transcriptional MerR regulator